MNKPLDGPTPMTDGKSMPCHSLMCDCDTLYVEAKVAKNLERIAAEAVGALESLRNEALNAVCYVGHDHQINADVVQKLDEQVDEAAEALSRIKAAGWEDKP